MRTNKGHNWYEIDLHLYTDEFLIEIIKDLLKTLEREKGVIRRLSEPLKEQIRNNKRK